MLENLDFVLNVMKENMVSMGIEAPNFPGDIHTDILHLTEAARMAVERAVLASRACLRDIQAVKDHLAKMMFCEKEADGHADKLKRAFFASVVWSGGLCLGADIHRFGARLLHLSVLFAERLQPDGVVNMGNTAFPSKCSPATSARWMSRPSRPERQALRYFHKLKSAIDAALPDIDFKTELKLIDNTLVEGIRVDPTKFKDLEKMHVLDPEPLRRCGNWPERPSPTLENWLRR